MFHFLRIPCSTSSGIPNLHTADMWDPLCAELGASRFVLNMDGKDHVRMRREMKSGLSRLLVEGQIPKAVNVVRRHLAAMPLNTRALVFLPSNVWSER